MESGAKSKSVWYLSGHGAKDVSAARNSRRLTQERYTLLGNTDVLVYTPVGDSRVSVESRGLPESYVYTNTSTIPSYLYALLCDERFNKRFILEAIAKISQKLDILSEIEYPNPGERFQEKPTDEKNYWGKPQGEDHRPKSGLHNRVYAKDPLHFPFCLTCITMYDAATGEIHSNIHPTIKEFMLSSHCGELEDHGDFPDRSKLLGNLEKEGLPLRTFLHPFKQSDTAGVFNNLADLNLFASKNSGMILEAMQKMAKDARDRLQASAADHDRLRAAANPYYEHDVWLTENLQLVTSFYGELVTTKKSTLTKIMAICKFVSPPNTDLEILDYTCSCDFATQPPLHTVSSGVTMDDSTPGTIGSFPSTSSELSSSESSSSQSSSSLPDSPKIVSLVRPPRRRASMKATDDIKLLFGTTSRRAGAAAATGDGAAAVEACECDCRPRSTTPPDSRRGSKGKGKGKHSGPKGGSIKRIRKRTQKQYISRKYNHSKKHKKRYYTKKRRNI
jgi:hypothetical protein